jgi:hypothetical protein
MNIKIAIIIGSTRIKPEASGSSNVGIFEGKEGKPTGDATNVIANYVKILGEARSYNAVVRPFPVSRSRVEEITS